jgi:hypothetical protein
LADASAFQRENRTYTEKADFSNCFHLFDSNSCSSRLFVIAMARSISSRASESLPSSSADLREWWERDGKTGY